jgi:DNA-binding SARP family transcriptional activator
MTPPLSIGAREGARVNLFGRPSVDGQHAAYEMRSRKSWALLAYLVLNEQPPTRTRLASLLFEEADDPLGALRWSLAEIRRALRGLATLEGDPVVLRRHPDLVVDVDVVLHGSWASALRLPGFGGELLEGLAVRGAVGFESWLLAEQRRLGAATSGVLRAAARATADRGDHRAAIGFAARRVALAPLDEQGHAELVELYRTAGDDVAARRQYATCVRMLDTELGVAPGW